MDEEKIIILDTASDAELNELEDLKSVIWSDDADKMVREFCGG